jgi:hypothetical protein
MVLSAQINGDTPAHFDPDELRRRRPAPPEFAQVEAASASRDLAAVKAGIDQWNEHKHLHNPLFERGFHAALWAAIQKNHVSVVSCLLDQGVGIMDLDFAEATKKKSYPMLQLLLDRGWNINTHMGGWSEPPALQYVSPLVE